MLAQPGNIKTISVLQKEISYLTVLTIFQGLEKWLKGSFITHLYTTPLLVCVTKRHATLALNQNKDLSSRSRFP